MGQDDKAIEETLDFKARFDQSRLLPAIVTDGNGVVLMFAYMNEQALKLTLQTKITHFWSRSRQSLWRKGETSGNFLHVLGVALDCDQDAIWVTAKLDGEAACHTGRYSCFYRHVILDENDNISLRFVENSHANISDAKAKD